MAQKSDTKDGYVVSERFILPPDTTPTWHNLRNFGDRQSDAIEFVKDVEEKLGIDSLIFLAKNYKREIKYIRINSRNFKKQTDK